MSEKQFSEFNRKLDTVAKELAAIRKLLILIASKSGSTSDDVGKVLGISGSAIRNILAEKKIKK